MNNNAAPNPNSTTNANAPPSATSTKLCGVGAPTSAKTNVTTGNANKVASDSTVVAAIALAAGATSSPESVHIR